MNILVKEKLNLLIKHMKFKIFLIWILGLFHETSLKNLKNTISHKLWHKLLSHKRFRIWYMSKNVRQHGVNIDQVSGTWKINRIHGFNRLDTSSWYTIGFQRLKLSHGMMHHVNFMPLKSTYETPMYLHLCVQF